MNETHARALWGRERKSKYTVRHFEVPPSSGHCSVPDGRRPCVSQRAVCIADAQYGRCQSISKSMSVGRERRQGEESALAESKAVVVMVVVVLDILRLWAAGEARSGPKPRPTRAPPTKPLPFRSPLGHSLPLALVPVASGVNTALRNRWRFSTRWRCGRHPKQRPPDKERRRDGGSGGGGWRGPTPPVFTRRPAQCRRSSGDRGQIKPLCFERALDACQASAHSQSACGLW